MLTNHLIENGAAVAMTTAPFSPPVRGFPRATGGVAGVAPSAVAALDLAIDADVRPSRHPHRYSLALEVFAIRLAGIPVAQVLMALENLAGSRAEGGEQS
jgi:hypothetical protein